MIYIKNDTELVKIPRITDGTLYRFMIMNQTTKKEDIFDVVDMTPTSKFFYTVNFTDIKEELPTGQYDYTVFDNEGNILSRGIMQVGDYARDNDEYRTEKEIIEYGK